MLMLKSRKKQRVRGNSEGRSSCCGRPSTGNHRAAAAAVTAREATAVGRPGFSPLPPAPGVRVGSPSRSCLLSKHILLIPSLSPSQRQLTGRSLLWFEDWQSRFSFSALHLNDTRACSSRCPCSLGGAWPSQLGPGLCRILSTRGLLKPYGVLLVTLPATKQDLNFPN